MDWNCYSASIGYVGGGEVPRLALSARNIALSEEANPGQDIVATCAACWLATKRDQRTPVRRRRPAGRNQRRPGRGRAQAQERDQRPP